MNHPSVKNGVLGAMINIIITLLLAFISARTLLSGSFWTGFIVFIYFMYLTGKESRELYGGYISFGEIFKYMFFASVIFATISVIFSYVQFNFIDPGLVDVQKDMAIEGIDKVRELLGDEAADSMEEQIEEQSFNLTIGKSLINLVFYVVASSIVLAIMAAIMKRKDPEELM